MDLGVRVSDLTGQKFGRLTVVKYAGKTKDHKSKWECKCECGNRQIVRAAALKQGGVKSCGCLANDARKENGKKMRGVKSSQYKHGLSGSRINGIYRSIKERCKNKNNPAYNHYGGRGIRICAEWDSDFSKFYEWSMANGYSPELTIDRIDNDGDYAPENCRWVSMRVQQNNRSNNVRITYNNETHTLSEWAGITGISKSALYHRYARGWPADKMLVVPVLYEPVDVVDTLSEGDRGEAGFGSTGV